jgi:hypothetical protein
MVDSVPGERGDRARIVEEGGGEQDVLVDRQAFVAGDLPSQKEVALRVAPAPGGMEA